VFYVFTARSRAPPHEVDEDLYPYGAEWAPLLQMCCTEEPSCCAPSCLHAIAARSTQTSKKRFVLGAIRIPFA
jgi:hypothetical protein